MRTITTQRHSIRSWRVPADVVDLFEPDAERELYVEPGRATIRRAGGVLRKSELDGLGYVLPDPKRIPPLPRPLTDAEREDRA